MFDLLFIYIVVEHKDPVFQRRHTRDLQQLPNKVKHPKDFDDLIAIMTQAAKENKSVKLKGVSTRYSAVWNKIAAADGCLINTATYANFMLKCLSL
jgi:hypothetical protein